MPRTGWLMLMLATASVLAMADEGPDDDAGFVIVSWNVAGKAFVAHRDAFHAVLARVDPDILLLDEVSPSINAGQLQKALNGLRPGADEPWHINIGKSGGRQRSVIASRSPLEVLSEFSSIVPYPEADQRRILSWMSVTDRLNPAWSMDGGIPVNGALVLAGDRRLLAVAADLQCCGSDPQSWQEFRRRVEVQEIRRRVRQVLERTPVDGIILAGDLNLVGTTAPLVALMGPYPAPHSGLIPVEIYHQDGSATWTWDGRGTPFPSGALDYQLYSPQALNRGRAYILDTEDLSAEDLAKYRLRGQTSSQLSDHRPLVVEYGWH